MAMGRYLALLCIVALVCLAGCKGKDSSTSGRAGEGSTATESGSSGSQANAGTPGSISGEGDAEAVKALTDELKKHWLQTPDGWYSEYPSQVSLLTHQRA